MGGVPLLFMADKQKLSGVVGRAVGTSSKQFFPENERPLDF